MDRETGPPTETAWKIGQIVRTKPCSYFKPPGSVGVIESPPTDKGLVTVSFATSFSATPDGALIPTSFLAGSVWMNIIHLEALDPYSATADAIRAISAWPKLDARARSLIDTFSEPEHTPAREQSSSPRLKVRRTAAIRAGCDAALYRNPGTCTYPACQEPMNCPAQQHVKAMLAALDVAAPVWDGPQSNLLRFLLCCGKDHCDAASHAADHDTSADGYANCYGCESTEMIDQVERALSAALLAARRASYAQGVRKTLRERAGYLDRRPEDFHKQAEALRSLPAAKGDEENR